MRIRHVLDRHAISQADIVARAARLQPSRGRPIAVDLQATQFGARVVAAMLELLVERLTQP